MSSFNKVILMGNLTRDPEMRYTTSGTAIANISLAVNRKWYNEARELQEETTFVIVDAFGKQAETIGQYFKKGNPIFLEGRLHQDRWEDKQTGQKRSQLKVVLQNFQFLPSGGQSREGGSPPSPRRAAADAEPQRPPQNQLSPSKQPQSLPPSAEPQRFHQPPPTDNGPPPEEDDDVPF